MASVSIPLTLFVITVLTRSPCAEATTIQQYTTPNPAHPASQYRTRETTAPKIIWPRAAKVPPNTCGDAVDMRFGTAVLGNPAFLKNYQARLKTCEPYDCTHPNPYQPEDKVHRKIYGIENTPDGDGVIPECRVSETYADRGGVMCWIPQKALAGLQGLYPENAECEPWDPSQKNENGTSLPKRAERVKPSDTTVIEFGAGVQRSGSGTPQLPSSDRVVDPKGAKLP